MTRGNFFTEDTKIAIQKYIELDPIKDKFKRDKLFIQEIYDPLRYLAASVYKRYKVEEYSLSPHDLILSCVAYLHDKFEILDFSRNVFGVLYVISKNYFLQSGLKYTKHLNSIVNIEEKEWEIEEISNERYLILKQNEEEKEYHKCKIDDIKRNIDTIIKSCGKNTAKKKRVLYGIRKILDSIESIDYQTDNIIMLVLSEISRDDENNINSIKVLKDMSNYLYINSILNNIIKNHNAENEEYKILNTGNKTFRSKDYINCWNTNILIGLDDDEFRDIFYVDGEDKVYASILKCVEKDTGKIYITDSKENIDEDIFDIFNVGNTTCPEELYVGKKMAMWNYNSRNPEIGLNIQGGTYRIDFDIDNLLRFENRNLYPMVFKINNEAFYLILNYKDKLDFEAENNMFRTKCKREFVCSVKTEDMNKISQKWPGIVAWNADEYYLIKSVNPPQSEDLIQYTIKCRDNTNINGKISERISRSSIGKLIIDEGPTKLRNNNVGVKTDEG